MGKGIEAVVRGVDAGDGVDLAPGQRRNDGIRAAAALDGIDVDGFLQGRGVQQLAPRVFQAQRDGVCALGDCGKSRVRIAAQHALTQLGAVKLRKLRLGRRLGLVDDDVGSIRRPARAVGRGGAGRLLRKLRLGRRLGLVDDDVGAIVGSIRRPARAVGRGGAGRLLGLLPRQVKADAAVGAVHCVALQDQKTDRREQDQAQQNDQNDPSRTALAVVAAVSLCRWHPSHLPFNLYGHFTSVEKENQQKFVNSC